jgi:hypothetical protein
MSGVLDLLLVAFISLAAGVFAFLSLAPRPWRAPVWRAMAAIAERLSMRSMAARLAGAARRSAAATGCGGCGDCGSGKPAGLPSKPLDVGVPLSSIKRRR